MAHFKLTKETKVINGINLYRIEATKDSLHTEKGEKGGWVESSDNLNDEAWIGEDVCVYNNARIYDKAMILGNAEIYGNAIIYGNTKVYGGVVIRDNVKVYDCVISDNAIISDNAKVSCCTISGKAVVSDNAIIDGNYFTIVSGNAVISDSAIISGKTLLYDNVIVSSNARISSLEDIIWLPKVGTELGTLTSYKNSMGDILVTRGGFNGTLQEFEKNAREIYTGNNLKAYLKLIDYIRFYFNVLYKKGE